MITPERRRASFTDEYIANAYLQKKVLEGGTDAIIVVNFNAEDKARRLYPMRIDSYTVVWTPANPT